MQRSKFVKQFRHKPKKGHGKFQITVFHNFLMIFLKEIYIVDERLTPSYLKKGISMLTI